MKKKDALMEQLKQAQFKAKIYEQHGITVLAEIWKSKTVRIQQQLGMKKGVR